MLDDKQKLEQYFEDEIQRVSAIEIKQIDTEIAQIHEKAIQELELEAQRDAGMVKEQEIKELQSEHAIRLSKVHEDTNRKLMAKRQALSEQVFEDAKQQILTFVKGADYSSFLKEKAAALAAYGYDEVIFYVGRSDQPFLKDLQAAYGRKCEGQIDSDIVLGGFRMECSAQGIVVDYSFDTALEEQKAWFYTNSGLFIR